MTPAAHTVPLGSKRYSRLFKAALFSLPLVALAVLLLWPAASRAEASFAGPSGKASASINFRIVIPPVMRVLENSHPAQLQPSADGSALTAEQRLVVVSNMKHGFCVALRQPSPELAAGWQLQQTAVDANGSSSGAVLSPLADGYRLCTSRPGRYTLRLQHAFPAPNPGQGATETATALHWPVQTELTAL
jgi:hypothetical protein